MNENIKQAFPAADLSGSQKEEIQGRSTTIAGGIQRKRRTRRTFAGALVTAALIAGGVMVGPAAYAVYRLNQIAGSLGDCRTMIREDFDIDAQGRQIPSGRTVYSEGRWRIERKGRSQVYENGILWIYDSKLNQVLKFDKPDGPFGYNASGASVKAMLRDVTSWQWNSRPSVSTATLDGRRVTKVTLDERTDCLVVYADEKTDMPLLFESYRKENGSLRLAGISKPKFNVPVDSKEFVRNFPTEAKVIDVAKVKSDWASKIETPLATLDFKKGTVRIRDYSVNSRGHVFVVYSNGETAADREKYTEIVRSGDLRKKYSEGLPVDFQIKDSLGNEYIRSRMSFQPYMGGYASRPTEWIVLKNNEVLRGEWFYPVNDQPWKAREIEMKVFHADEVHEWSVKVAKPTHELIAEWFRALAIAPRESKDIYDEENSGRREHYRRIGDHKSFIPFAHKEIARLEEFEREHGRKVSKMDIYYQLFEAHKGVGEPDTAFEWLTKSGAEPDDKNGMGVPRATVEHYLENERKKREMRSH